MRKVFVSLKLKCFQPSWVFFLKRWSSSSKGTSNKLRISISLRWSDLMQTKIRRSDAWTKSKDNILLFWEKCAKKVQLPAQFIILIMIKPAALNNLQQWRLHYKYLLYDNWLMTEAETKQTEKLLSFTSYTKRQKLMLLSVHASQYLLFNTT